MATNLLLLENLSLKNGLEYNLTIITRKQKIKNLKIITYDIRKS